MTAGKCPSGRYWRRRVRVSTAVGIAVALIVSLSAWLAGPSDAAGISVQGQRLASVLDAMDVLHHWLPHQRVNWRTGEPVRGALGGSTHCSAFVAAACDRLAVYILRPPEHPQRQLANAQHDWLLSDGANTGWEPVDSAEKAQRLANEGSLVVASYRNINPNKPGHIAIVRPSVKSDAEITDEGPEIIQAGLSNSNDTSLKAGFKHHPEAFREKAILFFAHRLPLAVP